MKTAQNSTLLARVKNKLVACGLALRYFCLQETLSPEFNHNRVIAIPAVNQEHLDYFDNGSITFFVMGLQEDTPPDASVKKLTTKVGNHLHTGSCGSR